MNDDFIMPEVMQELVMPDELLESTNECTQEKDGQMLAS